MPFLWLLHAVTGCKDFSGIPGRCPPPKPWTAEDYFALYLFYAFVMVGSAYLLYRDCTTAGQLSVIEAELIEIENRETLLKDKRNKLKKYKA